MTAPAAPATALPHGGSVSTFDCPAIAVVVSSSCFGMRQRRMPPAEEWFCDANSDSYYLMVRRITITRVRCRLENAAGSIHDLRVAIASHAWLLASPEVQRPRFNIRYDDTRAPVHLPSPHLTVKLPK
jgi:hypothetical protein